MATTGSCLNTRAPVVSECCFREYSPRTATDNEEPDMDTTDQVLEAMRAAGEPVAAGKVAEMTGLDRKVVDKAMDALKKSDAIESPVRCKWQPKG
jgi:hypothetical protein